MPEVLALLLSGLKNGLETFRSQTTPRLIRLAVPIETFSSSQFFHRVWSTQIDAMALRSATADCAYFCWGTELEVAGSQLDALKPVFAELSSKSLLEGSGHCPVVFFGSSFTQGQWTEQRRISQPPWMAWPHALLRVPAWVASFDRRKDTWSLTMNFWVRPDTDVEKLENRVQTRLATVESLLIPPSEFDRVVSNEQGHPDESKADWCRRVDEARQACGDRKFRKVVLARALQFQLEPKVQWDLAATWAALVRQEQACTTFVFTRQGQALIGATPESLLRIRDGQVETHALAGTTRRGKNSEEDSELGAKLLQSAKDLHEHQLVVRTITDTLYPWCEAVLVDHRPRLRVLERVQHLETQIHAQVKPGISLLGLSGALHPTPALAGAPRGAALGWLEEKEGLDRGWFGGLLGFVDEEGQGEAWVSIRSACLSRGHAWVYAGAGIVQASDPDSEWDETALKLQTMVTALRQCPEGVPDD